MATDNGIGLYAASGTVRKAALNRVPSNGATPMGSAAPVKPATEAVAPPRLLSMSSELAEQGPPVDVSRIATLRNAIADGSYHVDADKIANAMLRFHAGGE